MTYDPFRDLNWQFNQEPKWDPTWQFNQQPKFDGTGAEWDPIARAWRAGPASSRFTGWAPPQASTLCCDGHAGVYCALHGAWHMAA